MLRTAYITLLAFGILTGCKGSGETRRDEHRANEENEQEKAVIALADRAAHDRARTMARLGAACDDGEGANLDACRIACGLDHSNSCAWVAADYEKGRGVSANLAKARSYYLRACSGGSGLGCHGAARLFNNGRGVAPNSQRADKLFARARFYYRVHCSQGHALSCSRLADLFAIGAGGVTDLGVAEFYKLRACQRGLADDCARR